MHTVEDGGQGWTCLVWQQSRHTRHRSAGQVLVHPHSSGLGRVAVGMLAHLL